MHFTFVIEVDAERTEGKFASREDIGEQIQSELEGADPSEIEGGDGGRYEISSWEVSEQEPQPKGMLLVKASDLKRALSVTAPGNGTAAHDAVERLRARL